LPEPPDDPEHFQFISGIQSIPAFDLHGAGPHPNHFLYPAITLMEKLLFRGLMQQFRGIKDAPAPIGDLLVGQPLDAARKLHLTGTGINDMGMGVTPGRKDQPASAVHLYQGIRLRRNPRHLRHGTEITDHLITDQQESILNAVHAGHPGSCTPSDLPLFGHDQLPDILKK
jgi:hypothetical protein